MTTDTDLDYLFPRGRESKVGKGKGGKEDRKKGDKRKGKKERGQESKIRKKNVGNIR